MVFESVKKMKAGKAADPTGVVSEMLIGGGERCMKVVADLINSINRDRKMPKDWEESYIINLYKGKGDALVRGNYRGLKLLEHVMKVLERIVETQIRSSIKIDNMQFSFMPGRGTTDAIFIVRQLQEKFLAKNKNLYLAFVDLEKAFDRVPCQVLWWAMRKLGIDEWIVQKKLDAWKVNLEKKSCPDQNHVKTKIMFSGVNMDTLTLVHILVGYAGQVWLKIQSFAQVVNTGCIRSVVVFVAG